MTEEYGYKSEPFSHQHEFFQRTRDLERYALFGEQGTGKTKPTIDTTAWLFEKGKINGLLIIAPNGVHRNWISDELPAHLPARVKQVSSALCYHASKAHLVSFKETVKKFKETCNSKPGSLMILALSYDGFMTKEGRALALWFLEKRRCLYILDESHRIKSPGAKRTKAILASAKEAQFRRILTGTPIANGPFDAYTQMKFLNLEFWKPYYLDSYTIFKHHFGIWKKLDEKDTSPWAVAYCVAYRNLPQLNEILAQHSTRWTKDEVLDLPPKLYSKRYFELNHEQRRLYNELKEEFMTFLKDELITAPLIITRLLRLQQVTSGYLPADGGDPVYNIGNSNPRMKLLEDVIEDVPHKAIIWAKYTRDIDNILGLLGERAVRYDGQVDVDERAEAIEQFQRGKKQFFVCNLGINEGLTLHAARTVIYYNVNYNLTNRLQSEDRAHRIGQEHPVDYIDLVAQDTVDEDIVEALVTKHGVAAQILGDEVKKWLEK